MLLAVEERELPWHATGSLVQATLATVEKASAKALQLARHILLVTAVLASSSSDTRYREKNGTLRRA
jgi:hypothetical protein